MILSLNIKTFVYFKLELFQGGSHGGHGHQEIKIFIIHNKYAKWELFLAMVPLKICPGAALVSIQFK